jgi:hypothetical protein
MSTSFTSFQGVRSLIVQVVESSKNVVRLKNHIVKIETNIKSLVSAVCILEQVCVERETQRERERETTPAMSSWSELSCTSHTHSNWRRPEKLGQSKIVCRKFKQKKCD